jgi:hypothetical protein
MIQVTKPAAPAKLREGHALNRRNCTAFVANPAPFMSGARVLEIDAAIYGHRLVKDALRIALHGKCCFCEGKFEANAAADVEHFRPKKYSQQRRGGTKLYPGYYWLGYVWDNLLYSCQVCNRSNKRNYFPLRDPAARAVDHRANLAAEEPLLVDPAGPEDPRDHIRFRDEVAVGITAEGRTTVDILNLNRPQLIEDRLKEFKILKLMRKIVVEHGTSTASTTKNIVRDAQAYIGAATLPDARFSAMASDLINGTGVV